MIGSLRGVVAAIGEDAALIDVAGVGYVIQAGARTLQRLAAGDTVHVHVETHVREDAIRLFGFLSEDERAWFVHLQSVPSVGAKVALNILDTLTPQDLADAVAIQDKASLARANGVGPKLAARIVAELAGKPAPKGFYGQGFAPSAGSAKPVAAPAGGAGARTDAVSALVNLGIDQTTAARAVATAIKTFDGDPPAADLIRAALKEVQQR
ncbi:MAG: Holliday junction branch migration protein RuvA [Alphaproteobacteria bacterium]|nr:Holliday junction branch migration protein RuvA [Alphaproteobacteria bacterium]